jgi:hypothetical protein
MMDTKKKCLVCEEILSINNFEHQKNRPNPRNVCKTCRGRQQTQSRVNRNITLERNKLINDTRKNDCNDCCQICNIYDSYILTFDHLDPENKAKKNNDNNIRGLSQLPINKLKEELQKIHQWVCHTCHRIKSTEMLESNTREFGSVLKNELIKIMGGKCEICDENRDNSLAFDHINENLKTICISTLFQRLRFHINKKRQENQSVNTDENVKHIVKQICEEAKKCGILCHNCNYRKERYRVYKKSNIQYDKIPYFEIEDSGKNFVVKLNEYISKDRNYIIDSDELFEFTNTYKNEIITEKFNEQKHYLDSTIYNGNFKTSIRSSQYNYITLSDYTYYIIGIIYGKKELPTGIFKTSNFERSNKYRVKLGNSKMTTHENIEHAIKCRNKIILDDIENSYKKNSSVYCYFETLLNI